MMLTALEAIPTLQTASIPHFRGLIGQVRTSCGSFTTSKKDFRHEEAICVQAAKRHVLTVCTSSMAASLIFALCQASCSKPFLKPFRAPGFYFLPYLVPAATMSNPVESRLASSFQALKPTLGMHMHCGRKFTHHYLHTFSECMHTSPSPCFKISMVESKPFLPCFKSQTPSQSSCQIRRASQSISNDPFDSCNTSLSASKKNTHTVAKVAESVLLGGDFTVANTEADSEESMDKAAGYEESSCSNEEGMESGARRQDLVGTESISLTKACTQTERRQRGGASAAHQEVQDLLTVPGIGSRNMEKLIAKGIKRLVELKQLYRDKFLGDESEKMVEYLRSSVGIIHKNHASSIATFIKNIVDKELKDEVDPKPEMHLPSSKDRLTFCVEGNISVGKTTFLQRIANETLELRDLVEVVPEPIAKWQNVGPDRFNILNAFYAEPARYAYTFQNYVFVTRLMQERESANGLKPLRLMERSVFSDRMVFVRAVHEAKWMNEMEISIYDSWFDPVVSELPGLVPDGFIYLRASPDTCHKRLQSRKRPEEQTVSLEYLQGLHEKHEQWLFPAKTGSNDVFSVSRWPMGLKEPPPALIRDRVFYLQGEHVHTRLQKVPALVLDCEASIDFNKDIEAKAEYARQVAEFCDYVKRTKHIIGTQTTGVGARRPSGVLGPDGSLLRATMMESDLGKHFSSCCS